MMLRNVWIICSVLLIFFIMINNPKAQNINTPNKIFGATRTAEETTTKITWFLILLFFTLAILISSGSIS